MHLFKKPTSTASWLFYITGLQPDAKFLLAVGVAFFVMMANVIAQADPPPGVSVAKAAGQADPAMGPTSSTVINFTVTFTEPVTGFESSDVVVSGTAGATVATVSEVAPNDGTTYNVAVEGMVQSGTVTITVPANSAQDSAAQGNTSTAPSNTATVNFIADNFTTFEVTTVADPGDGSCTPSGIGDGCTLREAIAAANVDGGAETIVFSSSAANGATNFYDGNQHPITLSGTELVIDGDVTIQGPGANVLAVDGNQQSRVFSINAGKTVTISGVTVRNGFVPDGAQGAGIRSEATLTVTDSVFTLNHAGVNNTPLFAVGGAIYSTGSLTVLNCKLSDNFALSGGGGIYHSGPTLTISNSSFTGNGTNDAGGAIWNDGSATLTLTGSTLSGNSAQGGGGIATSGNTTIVNSTLSGNSAQLGGGILNSNGSFGAANVTVKNSTLSANSASNGGGIYNSADGGATAQVTIRNSTLSGNSAGQGGGIYNFNNPISVDPNTVTAVTIGSTILNAGSSGENISNNNGGTVTSDGYNLSNDAAGGDATAGPGGFLNGTGDIRNTDPKLAPLANYGGPTLTHALRSDSPAIDKGKNFSAATTDQRGAGFPRTVDLDDATYPDASDATDIGAYEMRELSQTGGTFQVTTNDDHSDGVCSVGDCTLREAIDSANAQAGTDTITFAAAVTGTIQLTTALPDLSSDMSITGPGANVLSVRGEGPADRYRIFTIPSGVTVNISGLTIRNGYTADGTDGVVSNGTSGGGIDNAGTLTLTGDAISGNQTGRGGNLPSAGPSPGRGGFGGGINNTGTLTIINSTLSGNQTGAGGSSPGYPGLGGFGGGINNSGTLTISNSTLSGNQTGLDGSGSFRGDGGGVFNTATLTISNSTVTANTAGQGGGVRVGAGVFTLSSTIVAGNSAGSGPDISGSVQSDGYNLIGDNSGATINQNPGAGPNIVNVDAKLNALANNGGPTQTHRPQSDSPAIDQGKNFSASSTDQRGLTRTIDNSVANASAGDGTDIGAVELNAGTLQFSSASQSVSESGGSVTVTVTRTGGSEGAVSVNYATANGTATGGADYTTTSGTLNWGDGDTANKTFTVGIIEDNIFEGNETFSIGLSSPGGAATLGTMTQTATIIDNDPQPTISISDVSLNEGNSGNTIFGFLVTLSNPSSSVISANYKTNDGTAVAGSDYQAKSDTVIFSPGQTLTKINVLVIGDTMFEPNETFTVTLSNPVNATLLRGSGTATIQNDDATPTPTATATATATPTATASATPTATATATASATATPTATPVVARNISTRARIESGDNVMIAGFIITGSVPKKTVVRGLGPSLQDMNLAGALADPVLEVRGSSGALILGNDNWQDDPAQATQIQASGLAPSRSQESAIILTLVPGTYTAIVRGKNNTTGIGVVEVYDVDNSPSELANLSARSFVQLQENVMIGGFTLGSGISTNLVLRALGPSLSSAGINNPLADPTLDVRDANGNQIAFNDNWQDDPVKAAQVMAKGLAPANNNESAIPVTLPPGAYTAIVRGKNNGIGVGLVEIYNTH